MADNSILKKQKTQGVNGVQGSTSNLSGLKDYSNSNQGDNSIQGSMSKPATLGENFAKGLTDVKQLASNIVSPVIPTGQDIAEVNRFGSNISDITKTKGLRGLYQQAASGAGDLATRIGQDFNIGKNQLLYGSEGKPVQKETIVPVPGEQKTTSPIAPSTTKPTPTFGSFEAPGVSVTRTSGPQYDQGGNVPMQGLGIQSTHESTSQLGETIRRNADPAFQQRLAEQNRIVEERMAKTKAFDEANPDFYLTDQAVTQLNQARKLGNAEGIKQAQENLQQVHQYVSARDAERKDMQSQSPKSGLSQEQANKLGELEAYKTQQKMQEDQNKRIGEGVKLATGKYDFARENFAPDARPSLSQTVSLYKSQGAPLNQVAMQSLLDAHGLTDEFNQTVQKDISSGAKGAVLTQWLKEAGLQPNQIQEYLTNLQ